jgi:transposase
MNILVHEVISDITGVSGLAILDAILAGERSPAHLLRLCDGRIKATEEDIKKALVGDWREEHLFTLRQSLASWRHFQTQIAECDAEITRLMSDFEDTGGPLPPQEPIPKGRKKASVKVRSRAQEHSKRIQLNAIFGVDVTQVPGIAVGCAELFFTEIGRGVSRFPTPDHFASYLGLAPDNRESGGKILSRKTRRTKNRLATQLRLSANTLTRSDTYLGAYLRKMKSRLGAAKGITATARKLAIILYTVVTRKTPYDESVFAKQEERHREKRLNYLKQQAAEFGFDFVPRQCVS